MKGIARVGLYGVVGLMLAHGAVGLAAQAPNVIAAVRAAIAEGDFEAGDRIVADHRAARGDTPELLEALSWLGRGALAAKRWDMADAYATRTYNLARAALEDRSLDEEPHLPIALGAAIEVRAHARVETGARSEAVLGLQRELATYQGTSLVKRIQKNINLLSLEGQVAPVLDLSESLEPNAPALTALKEKVVILFFWAHWCPDCKQQGPVLASLLAKYGSQGLTMVAPSQRYGYVAEGRPAPPAEERQYIRSVRDAFYGALTAYPVPLSEVNHQRYGVSTTPTLVLVDRAGIVRLYHPGQMTMAELDPLIRGLLASQPTA